jgi:hypothetical protein
MLDGDWSSDVCSSDLASTAIATGWSLCSGIVVVQFVLAMRAGMI